jgi:hypothetical protein
MNRSAVLLRRHFPPYSIWEFVNVNSKRIFFHKASNPQVIAAIRLLLITIDPIIFQVT